MCGFRVWLGVAVVVAAIPEARVEAESVDENAQKWWHENGAQLEMLARRLHDDGLPDDAYLLVLLPSGRPVVPTPSSLPEGIPIQPVIISPKDNSIATDIKFKTCAEIERFRVRGTAGVAATPPSTDFELSAVGQWFRCGAGELNFQVVADQPVTLEMRPIYHLAAVAVVGYDSASLDGFGRSTDRSMDPPAVSVGERDDVVGMKIYVGAQLTPTGADYEGLSLAARLLNIFAAVDPESPLDDLVAGLAFTPWGGLSLAVGVSVHRGTRLVDYAVGDPFTGDGEIPTERSWSDAEVGGFVGLAVDSNIYKALKKAF